MDREGSTLYAGTGDGRLVRWQLDEKARSTEREVVRAFADKRAITSLALLLGRRLAGRRRRRGRADDLVCRQRRRHPQAAADPPTQPTPGRSPRDPAFRPQQDARQPRRRRHGASRLHDERAKAALHRAAEGRPLREWPWARAATRWWGSTPPARLTSWRIDGGCPEISFKTLFGKVFYEGYDEPEYVWQTTGGEDFEPKFSLVPLVFGTLKGTFYAMLFAAPLALFGAAYVSYFTTPAFRGMIKPVVEIMATVPSVVIGFLIALWLAPILERWILAFFREPGHRAGRVRGLHGSLASAAAVRLGQAGGKRLRIPCLAAGAGGGRGGGRLAGGTVGSVALSRQLPPVAFRGAAGHALRPAEQRHHRLRPGIHGHSDHLFDRRGFALERALQHDGRVDGLGGSRWQTLWRVVLPSASPGIFAAMMIGFGRAVGETMIVLMATGNTPILDWSPLNGMRTLSANIAVEIPEAPVGGTLYRVLFLCAVLLFLLTFTVNTAAELVRQRLRKRFGRF